MPSRNEHAPRLKAPPEGQCQFCASYHPAEQPHNLASPYYVMQFHARFRRWPRAADAIAHCPPRQRRAYEHVLRAAGAWTDLPPDVDPIDQEPRYRHFHPQPQQTKPQPKP